MHIRPGEERVDLVEGLRGGVGVVELRHLMESVDFHGSGRQFAYMVLRPGCSIGYHRHDHDFEAYYILRGEGTYNDNGNLVQASPGDFLLCRPGESHGFVNDREADIEYLALILFVKD